jgi:hypothetical protein
MLITSGVIATVVVLVWCSTRIHGALDLGTVSRSWLAEYRQDAESKAQL